MSSWHVPATFPNESAEYRTARRRLLEAERDLRAQVEQVAHMRRELPLGGETPQDYVFDEGAPVKLSELFQNGRDSLLIYSFMYGPNQANPCPMCTSFIDSLNGAADHVNQRANLAIVAKSPIARIREFANSRGWNRLRLLSAAGNTYNRDYHAEAADGIQQLPAMNVFVRRDGKIHHFYNTELMYEDPPKGQNERHNDLMWPLWNLLDLTREGRGSDWYPRLKY